MPNDYDFTDRFWSMIHAKIRTEVQAYADKHKITYDEAARKAYIKIGDKKIVPFDAEPIEVKADGK